MTATAFDHADLVRRVAERDARPIASMKALADELNRDPSNLRKTIKALADDGLFAWQSGELPTLTDLGRQTLRGIEIAQGLAPDRSLVPAPTRWPLHLIRPNPANRPIHPDSIPDMAASIVGVGDILQPLLLTPADANGVRMILAGERRWRGACLLRDQDNEEINDEIVNGGGRTLSNPNLPEPLEAGAPFVEREATDAEALLITVVENAQREDMTPWEDAQQLLKLQQATGWSGAQLARQIGRADANNRNGEKDVTDKLRIARDATPEQIAAYEANGSWDAFRNAVFGRAAAAVDPWLSGGFVQGDTFKGHRQSGIRCAQLPTLTLYHKPNPNLMEGGSLWRARATFVLGGGRTIESSPIPGAQARAIAIQIAIDDIIARWPDAQRGQEVSREEIEWLDNLAGPFVVGGRDTGNATRAQERRFALGWDKHQSNSGGGSPRAAEPANPADPALPGTDVETDTKPLSPRARLAMVELAHKMGAQPRSLATGGTPAPGDLVGVFVGRFWTDAVFNELASGERLIRAVSVAGGVPPMATLTDAGNGWLLSQGYEPPISDVALREAQGPGVTAVLEGAYSTDFLANEVAAAATASVPTETQAELLDDPIDDWGRSASDITDDQDLLAEVAAFKADPYSRFNDATGIALLARLNIEGPFTEDGGRGVVANIENDAASLLSVDCKCDLAPERARAVALLVAWALEAVFGSGAAA